MSNFQTMWGGKIQTFYYKIRTSIIFAFLISLRRFRSRALFNRNEGSRSRSWTSDRQAARSYWRLWQQRMNLILRSWSLFSQPLTFFISILDDFLKCFKSKIKSLNFWRENSNLFTRRLVKCWFIFLVIAINLWVGGCSLLYNLTEGNSSTASEAREDSEGTEGSLAGWPASLFLEEAPAEGVTAAGERRDVEATATASSSLNVRLSLTRSDKLLTVKWNFFWDFSSWA